MKYHQTFPDALAACISGVPIRQVGWDDPAAHVSLQRGLLNEDPGLFDYVGGVHKDLFFTGGSVRVMPSFQLRTSKGVWPDWRPTGAEMAASDWVILTPAEG